MGRGLARMNADLFLRETSKVMLLHKEITSEIIRAFYNVYNELGYGFLEKVYERAMMIELAKLGLSAKSQVPIPVYYDEQLIGEYYADLVVEGKVIVELKAAHTIIEQFEAQLLNYLKATDVEVGLVLNFGPEPNHLRRVFSNTRK